MNKSLVFFFCLGSVTSLIANINVDFCLHFSGKEIKKVLLVDDKSRRDIYDFDEYTCQVLVTEQDEYAEVDVCISTIVDGESKVIASPIIKASWGKEAQLTVMSKEEDSAEALSLTVMATK